MSSPPLRAYDRAAVVIPAHNEQANLPACLRAVVTAALCVPIPVAIVVVLDASDDDSAKLAGRYGPDVHFVSVDARNVGAARAVGFGYARSLCGRRHRVLVCHHRCRQPGGPGLADTSTGARRGHGSGRGAGQPTGATIPPTSPTAMCRLTTRARRIRTAGTNTFTARTWASVPGPTGGLVAFARCPPARMSTW